MKTRRTLLVIGLLGAWQVAIAGDQPTNSAAASTAFSAISVTNTNQPAQTLPKLKPAYSTAQYKLMEPVLIKKGGKTEETRILRFGSESSQAWTTIATHQPNPTVVHDLSTHESRFCLCSFGQNPWPWR
jgi:hypothetical protein